MIQFPCGCQFKKNEKGLPIFDPNVDTLPLECSRTWDMICEGNTKGVFQLESNLGQSKASQVNPRNINELSDLLAIIRPGCCSGDTKVLVSSYQHKDGKIRYRTKTMKELFLNSPSHIFSLGDSNLIENKLNAVIYSGKKECFRLSVRKYSKGKKAWINKSWHKTMYNGEYSDDHKFLTSYGQWVELQYLEEGDRIAVHKKRRNSSRGYKDKVANRHSPEASLVKNAKNSKYFSEICYQNYEEKCVNCGWNKSSLDTHHLEGDRYQDNSPDNLVFLCPNCHRLHDRGLLSSEEIIEKRDKYKLPFYEGVEWVSYMGKESVGIKDTFDLSMEQPYHNFIAGDFVVHNCGDSIVDGKSLTQHYIDRKSKKDPVKFFDPRLEPILGSTYGILVYQEQAMQISQLVAGFTLQQADALRKAIGKKKADLMAEVKEEFIKGAEKLGKFSKNDASEIFSWIEKSQKYSFNKSHSVSYALNAYQTAYAKAHFPRAFFTSYLRHADGKPKPFVEINELVNNARSMDIDVMPPSIKNMNSNFCLIDKKPTFGIVNVKNVGMTVFEQIKGIAKLEKIDVSAITWEEFILKFGRYIKSNSFESMIKAGVFDCYGRSRGEMLHHFNIYKDINNEFKEYLAKVEEKEIGPAFLNLINHIMQSDKRADVKTRRIEELHGAIEVIDKVPYDIKDKPSWIAQQEKELLGIEIVCSEVDEYNTSYATHSCREFKKGMGDKSIRIAAKAEDIREYKVKRGKSSGQKMAFIKISDITCCIDATAFTEEWAQIKKKLDVGGVYLFIGDRDHKTKTSFLLKNVQKLNKCI